ncbi:MAG: hypothetical protein M3Q30_22350 [Actinomycetota bacterium]|nr:hypothetical protein [Actinomycetota bacterium]
MKLELISGGSDANAGFPARLARWLTTRAELIGVIVELRRTGHAPDAVTALLAISDVAEIRAAWEEWLTFVDDADRAASVLLDAVRADLLAEVMFAFWATSIRTEGLSNGPEPQPRVVAITGRTPRTWGDCGWRPPHRARP